MKGTNQLQHPLLNNISNFLNQCLIPLANTPLIEYTLEFLATAGVSQVYIACCSHAEMVENYLKKSKWNSSESPFSIQTMSLPESLSVGDVMRDLDTKGVIKSDFILISGDVVCNIDFGKVLKVHNERKTKDKNLIMTMVLREAGSLHRTRSRAHPGIFVLDEETKACLRYEVATLNKLDKLQLDSEVLQEHDAISIRNDLIDCRIDICTIDVPALFTENFDYDHLRTHFVSGILTSDLLGKTIYTHILDSNYAGRVDCLQTYNSVSKDIISRYAYPITPDSNRLSDQKYSYQPGHIYKEDGVVLAQSCNILSSTVIGKETFIGEGTVIDQSVIGRKCNIGKNVKLQGAYVWDNVTIEDNVIIKDSIIAHGAVIRQGVIVEPGCVISFDVVIGENTKVDKNVKLTNQIPSQEFSDDDSYDDDEDEDEAEEESDNNKKTTTSVKSYSSYVGKNGKGYDYQNPEDDVEDEDLFGDQLDGLIYKMNYLNMSDDSFDIEAKIEKKPKRGHHRTLSSTSAASGATSDDEEDFFREAVASVERSIMEGHSQTVTLLELNTLRMTMNAGHDEVRSAVIYSLIAHITRLVTTETMDVKNATEELFTSWSHILSSIVFEDDDEVDLLLKLQSECSRRPQGTKMLFYAASTMYDVDVVKESNIYKWWDCPQSVATDSLKEVRKLVSKWVEWLKTAEEESD